MTNLYRRVQAELVKMSREVALQTDLGLMSLQEALTLAKETADAVAYEVANIRLLEWFLAENAKLFRKRELHEVRPRLQAELEIVLKENKFSEEEAKRLRAELLSFEDVVLAKRWLGRLKSEKSRQADRLAREELLLRVKSAPRSEVSADPDPEPSDYRINCLEHRAGRVHSQKAAQLYAAGLVATGRRDKIRLFKATIHEERHAGG